jgi:hypothetical protein
LARPDEDVGIGLFAEAGKPPPVFIPQEEAGPLADRRFQTAAGAAPRRPHVDRPGRDVALHGPFDLEAVADECGAGKDVAGGLRVVA